MTKPDGINILTDTASLIAINGEPSAGTTLKKITQLERHSRNFIARSPFCMLATSSNEGCDASPRGDAPGFVYCLDDTTLLIPERPGNRIADSMSNIINHSEMGLLFLIPGRDDTLRVNGHGYLTDHPPYLELLAARAKTPKLAIVLDITELYFHCPKAFIRSGLWDTSRHMPTDELPTLGRMILEQINGEPPSKELQDNIDKALDEDSRDNLY
ncbi:MAG: pyridoxamine 5'-phosphate oxidase family protein [Gammaproteobacteria bacterium]|nr:pyridoxamine 5'-phosphate oxidase family protein [Gammaproteobacteria bacterium]